MSAIVAWFARNTVAANLLMLVAFVGGVFSYFQMEQEMFPVVQVTGASVSIAWPGASPQDTEEQLVTRIEEVVADMDGLKTITSTAFEGGGRVDIEGRDDIDMQAFLDEVKLRVDQINNLPQAAFPPRVTRWEGRNWYMGMVIHGRVDQRTMKRVTDNVRDRIAQISGGELAVVQAVLPEEVSIEVTEDSLRRYNLSFSDVANAIRASSLNSSGGRIESSTGDIAISARNLADTKEQFENIIIRQTTASGTIRLSDVATVIDGFVDANLKATFDDKNSAFVMLPAPDKMDIVKYSNAIKAFIEKANDPANGILPEAVQIDILWDDSVTFKARMDLIAKSAVTGAILVMLVLILFLRPAVAFWVTIGIITAFAGGILILPYMGVSWNILSTFAVLLVIGVIVDDAIVVGENIHKEVESGRREGLDAAIFGTQMVLKPVIFGVLTTIIAFLPWAFLTGPVRVYTQQITFVVIAALTFSIIECMLILPAHLSHMKKQTYTGFSGRLMRIQSSIADSLLWFAANIYKPILDLALRFRYATVAFFIGLFLLAIGLVSNGFAPFKMMPEIEGDLIQVTINMPDGTPFSRTLQVRDQVQNGVDVLKVETAKQYPDLEDGLIEGASVVATNGRIQAWIGLVSPEVRPIDVRTKDISTRLRELVGDIQDAEDINFAFTLNHEDSGLRFALSHKDLDYLRKASAEVQAHLATYDSTYDIGDNLSSAAEEIRISMKPGAEALGIRLADVTRQIRQAYFGEEVMRLPRNGEDVRVMVRLPRADRKNLDSLENLRVRTNDGREIPITQIAEFSYAPGINQIRRRNRTRSVTVFAQVKGEGVAGDIRKNMDEEFWPEFEKHYPGISRESAGGFEAQQDFFSEVTRFSIIAFGVMYILLAVAFRSYAQPILLMMALPFAYTGAVFGHVLFGVPMAMFSFFGIAAAAGVVINDNLVLIDYVNRLRAQGTGAIQSLVNAGVSRFRPILLTSVTTFVGILPLIAERSVQAQFLKPMVISLGCAVAFALFVSLLMVPALYAVGVEIGRIFRWTWSGKRFQPIGEDYAGVVTVDEEELIGSSHDHTDPSGTAPHGGLAPAE